jgi:hypothetical protein
MEFYELNGGEYNGIKLPKYPWTVCKKSVREFFDTIFPERLEHKNAHGSKYKKIQRKTLEEHMQLIKDNKILTELQYRQFFKDNNLKLLGFYSVPWKVFNICCKKIFVNVYPHREDFIYDRRSKKTKITPTEHLEYIKKYNLLGARKYREFYLKNRNELDLLSRPWDRFGLTEAEFFGAIKEDRLLIPRGTLWKLDVKEQTQEQTLVTGS